MFRPNYWKRVVFLVSLFCYEGLSQLDLPDDSGNDIGDTLGNQREDRDDTLYYTKSGFDYDNVYYTKLELRGKDYDYLSGINRQATPESFYVLDPISRNDRAIKPTQSKILHTSMPTNPTRSKKVFDPTRSKPAVSSTQSKISWLLTTSGTNHYDYYQSTTNVPYNYEITSSDKTITNFAYDYVQTSKTDSNPLTYEYMDVTSSTEVPIGLSGATIVETSIVYIYDVPTSTTSMETSKNEMINKLWNQINRGSGFSPKSAKTESKTDYDDEDTDSTIKRTQVSFIPTLTPSKLKTPTRIKQVLTPNKPKIANRTKQITTKQKALTTNRSKSVTKQGYTTKSTTKVRKPTLTPDKSRIKPTRKHKKPQLEPDDAIVNYEKDMFPMHTKHEEPSEELTTTIPEEYIAHQNVSQTEYHIIKTNDLKDTYYENLINSLKNYTEKDYNIIYLTHPKTSISEPNTHMDLMPLTTNFIKNKLKYLKTTQAHIFKDSVLTTIIHKKANVKDEQQKLSVSFQKATTRKTQSVKITHPKLETTQTKESEKPQEGLSGNYMREIVTSDWEDRTTTPLGTKEDTTVVKFVRTTKTLPETEKDTVVIIAVTDEDEDVLEEIKSKSIHNKLGTIQTKESEKPQEGLSGNYMREIVTSDWEDRTTTLLETKEDTTVVKFVRTTKTLPETEKDTVVIIAVTDEDEDVLEETKSKSIHNKESKKEEIVESDWDYDTTTVRTTGTENKSRAQTVENNVLKPKSIKKTNKQDPEEGLDVKILRDIVTSDWEKEYSTSTKRDLFINYKPTTTPVTTKTLPECKWPTTSPPTTIITTTTTEKCPVFDLKELMSLISNLTFDYETNITHYINESLQRYSIPTCKTYVPPTTVSLTPEPTTSTEPPFYAGPSSGYGLIIAKCFVCGLEDPGIPYDANCADAFAGDFLPLVPVDPTARGKMSKYRKYCRFKDTPNMFINVTDPRSVYGRWTGGCAVRWNDISGVYTQRTCRNRYRATIGKHFASKRMAKLEMALSGVDNGCIASPSASLIPLSRGISLFAKFHACVCTGSWCNISTRQQHRISLWYIILVFINSMR